MTVSEEHDESTRGDEEARCGTPDNDEGERYLSNRKWDKTNLKYHIWYSRDIHLPYKTQEEVMKRAFAQWSKASPKLNFTQTYCLEEADIKIRFISNFNSFIALLFGVIARAFVRTLALGVGLRVAICVRHEFKTGT